MLVFSKNVLCAPSSCLKKFIVNLGTLVETNKANWLSHYTSRFNDWKWTFSFRVSYMLVREVTKSAVEATH